MLSLLAVTKRCYECSVRKNYRLTQKFLCRNFSGNLLRFQNPEYQRKFSRGIWGKLEKVLLFCEN
jgi:hypothetical protein